MENFPEESGFLIPKNQEFISTLGRGHRWAAAQYLKKKGIKDFKNEEEDFLLQTLFNAILIRFSRGQRLCYLPPKAPEENFELIFLREAVKIYRNKGFQIINIYRISLGIDIDLRTGRYIPIYEKNPQKLVGLYPVSYNKTIIGYRDNYTYNPWRQGD